MRTMYPDFSGLMALHIDGMRSQLINHKTTTVYTASNVEYNVATFCQPGHADSAIGGT